MLKKLFSKKSIERKEAYCWFCGGKLIWQSDSMREEWGMYGEGVVAVLLCSSCDCEVHFIENADEESEP